MFDIVVMLICLFYLIDIYFIVKGFILIYECKSLSLSLCHCLWKAEEGAGSSGDRVTGSCELCPVWVLGHEL